MSSLFHVTERQHSAMVFMTSLASKPEVFFSLNEVAKNMGLSEGYLEEVVPNLKQVGLIEGKKGPGGGYRLAKAAKEITAEAILMALDGPVALVPCHGAACPVAHACTSKSLWNKVQSSLVKTLQGITLAELV